MSPRRHRVCKADELVLGKAQRFELDGREICVVRCTSGIHAVDDLCSHEDYSLSEGDVDPDACEVECWAHGSVFSLDSGEPQNLPATRPIAVHLVELEGDDVVVVIE